MGSKIPSVLRVLANKGGGLEGPERVGVLRTGLSLCSLSPQPSPWKGLLLVWMRWLMACSRSRFFTHWIPRFWKLSPSPGISPIVSAQSVPPSPTHSPNHHCASYCAAKKPTLYLG